MDQWTAKKSALWKHFRMWHGYEPKDWRGESWRSETPRQDYDSWLEVHAREHEDPGQYELVEHPEEWNGHSQRDHDAYMQLQVISDG